jgi:hypothetical protein
MVDQTVRSSVFGSPHGSLRAFFVGGGRPCTLYPSHLGLGWKRLVEKGEFVVFCPVVISETSKCRLTSVKVIMRMT